MKTALRTLLLATALAAAGCATITKNVTADVALVRDSFNSLLPPDFSGPIELHRSDMYVTFDLKASGVKKNAAGQWTWTWVNYHRTASVPWFAGLTWKSDVLVVLGAP